MLALWGSKCHNVCVLGERKSGTTGMPFGRTELSICGNSTKVCVILRRGGPVGPKFQGMPEDFEFHVSIKVQKWVSNIPKDAARLGDLEKGVFGPKFLKKRKPAEQDGLFFCCRVAVLS